METTTEVLSIGAAACAIASLLILVRIHLLPGGRAWPLAPLSELGTGPHHRYYRALVVLLAAAAGLLVAALDRGTAATALGLGFLGVFAVARLAMAVVLTDAPDRGITARGRIHRTLGTIAFVAVAFGAADVTDAIESTAGWTDGAGATLRFASDAIGVAAVLALAAAMIPQAREHGFPLAERLHYVVSGAWFLVAGLHLATLAAGG